MKLIESQHLSANYLWCHCVPGGRRLRIRRFHAELFSPDHDHAVALQWIHMAECEECLTRRIAVYPAHTFDGSAIEPGTDLMNSAEWAVARAKRKSP